MRCSLKQYIRSYGISKQNGFIPYIFELLSSMIINYNHSKYWKRRYYVVDANKRNIVLKYLYFLYLKRTDAKRLSSFGTIIDGGAVFSSPPKLPHGPNGIIIGFDARVGSNVTIYQHVTIPQGGCVIGDNVILGAGCYILPNITIGNNAKIGANAVVTTNVPEGCTAVGNPAKIINKKLEE